MPKMSAEDALRQTFRSDSGRLIQVGTGLRLQHDTDRQQDYQRALTLYRSLTGDTDIPQSLPDTMGEPISTDTPPKPAYPTSPEEWDPNYSITPKRIMGAMRYISSSGPNTDIEQTNNLFSSLYNGVNFYDILHKTMESFPIENVRKVDIESRLTPKLQTDIRKLEYAMAERVFNKLYKLLGTKKLPVGRLYDHITNDTPENIDVDSPLRDVNSIDINLLYDDVKKYVIGMGLPFDVPLNKFTKSLHQALSLDFTKANQKFKELQVQARDPKNRQYIFDIGFDMPARDDFSDTNSVNITRVVYINSHNQKAVKLSNFQISDDVRGYGFAKEYYKSILPVFDKMGIKKLEMNANMDVGGYAWAKYGFYPTKSSWDALRETLSEAMDDQFSILYEAPDAVKKLVAKIIYSKDNDFYNDKNNPKNLWAIADIPVWGKKILAGTSWVGELDLDKNSIGRKRLEKYIYG